MAYRLEFVGYCSELGHNKIWGWYVNDDGVHYNFWGKFDGRPLTFKIYEGFGAADKLAKLAWKKLSPRDNGQYHEVKIADLETVIPGFGEKMEMQLVMAKLGDKFHGNG